MVKYHSKYAVFAGLEKFSENFQQAGSYRIDVAFKFCEAKQ
jgi:hypothetical protein